MAMDEVNGLVAHPSNIPDCILHLVINSPDLWTLFKHWSNIHMHMTLAFNTSVFLISGMGLDRVACHSQQEKCIW